MRAGIFRSATSSLASAAGKRLLIEAASQIREGSLQVVFPDRASRVFGRPGAQPAAGLHILADEFFSRVLLGGEIGLGEAYMDGLWRSDDLVGLLALGIVNREHAPKAVKLLNDASRLASRGLHLGRRNTHAGSKENIRAHYDLGNDLFRLFLDETMTYSCAYFESDRESLADAQRAKYRRLCEKAGLTPADHVLEIGSGWGGFAIYAAETYGCKVTAITISREQLDLARSRVAEAGLSGQVAVEFCDYRDVGGCFDKIVSIEMFEAVGAEYFETFFQKCDSVLTSGGRLALQTISVPDRTFIDLRDGVNWMQKYIFPGGMLPSLSEIERSLQRTGLVVTGVEDIGLHYCRTLSLWREGFFANLAAVRALGFDQRFVRMWEYYLCASEAGFRTRSTGDLQVVFDKPGPSA